MFVHVVNFWLKEGISEQDRLKFEAGVSSLDAIGGKEVFNVGKPASTNRPVIDRSYDYCLLLVFKDLAAHDAYQIDPIHLKFVETCNQYWDRVLIYDSETV
ncbi:MAG: Dabb family protein [Siphonobacter sp.]